MSKDLRSYISAKIEEIKEINKNLCKPQSSRLQHRALYEWSRKELSRFEKIMQSNQQSEFSAGDLQNQKKVVISMLLQITRLAKQQCMEKGLVIEEMLHHAIQFMNQHQKYYDMLSYTQIKHFRDSIEDMEKEYGNRNEELRAQIDVLTKDKEHRWRNIFMVVKDNRVLRRQKGKLLRKHKEEVWRTKQLEEDLISVRSQNQKYKIMCEEYKLKENELKNYVTNQLLLLHLDQKVKKYPGRARRLLKKQLLNCEINELNTLQEKIKFILQAMEQNNEVCQDFDDWNDNIDSARLFYNVSVQTYVQVENVAINTMAPILPTKTYQSTKAQVRLRDFMLLEDVSKTVDIKIMPSHKKAMPERKKTQDLSISVSRFKRRVSISNSNANEVVHEKQNESSGFKEKLKIVQNTVSFRFVGNRNGKVNKNFTSMVLNISSKDELNEAETKQNNEQKSSEGLVSSKIKFNKIKRRQKVKTYQNEVLTENERKRTQIPQMSHQIYQLYFKPAPESRPSHKWNEDILEEVQPQIHLEEKVFTKPKPVPKHRSLLQTQNLSILVQNKYLKNKTLNSEAFKQNLRKDNTFAIIQVQETTSNRTIESVTHGILQNLEYAIEDGQRVGKKEFKILNPIEKGKKQLNQLKVSKQTQAKLIDELAMKRHKRQNTQNIEVMKSKSKVVALINEKKESFNSIRDEKNENVIPEMKIRDSKALLSSKEPLQDSIKNLSPNVVQKTEVQIYQKQSPSHQKFVIKSEKLLQKLANSIFMRRKEVIGNPQSLRIFLHSFLLSLFENKSSNLVNKIRPQTRFYTAIKNVDDSEMEKVWTCLLIQNLLSSKRYQLFTEDIFVLFAKMIDKLNSMGVLTSFNSIFHVPFQYGIRTVEYLCSIYLSSSQSLDFILRHIRTKEEPKTLNMVECFLKLSLLLERIIFNSELWQFMESISRWSVDNVSDSEIKELFTLFNLMDAQSESHFERISFYASKTFPLHRLCLYAHRFEWKRIYNIRSWIQEKYLEYFGFYCLSSSQVIDLCHKMRMKLQKVNQSSFMLRLLKQMLFKCGNLGLELDLNFIKLCRLTIFFLEVERVDIFPQRLQFIHQRYRKYCRTSSSDPA